MLRPPLSDVLTDAAWTLVSADATVPTARTITIRDPLHRRNPIAGIQIQVYVKLASTAGGATMNADGMANVLKSVQLYRNGVDASSGTSRQRGRVQVVNCSGPSLLKYMKQVDLLDRATVTALGTAVANNAAYTFTYFIPFAHPQLNEPLHTHCLLPVHLDAFNPELVLNFSAQNEMDVNGTPTLKYQSLIAKVTVLRYDLPPEDTAVVLGAGGFIDRVFSEKEWQINAKQRWQLTIDSPGRYEGLLLQTYPTNAAVGDISDANNPVWLLQQQGSTRREFLIDHLLAEGERSAVQTGVFTSGAYWLDFIASSLGAGQNSLRSTFDTNLDTNNGQVSQIVAFLDPVGNSGSLSTSRIRMFGVAMLGDISSRLNVLA